MYVRWKRRQQMRPPSYYQVESHPRGRYRLTAVLLESHRLNGKPRQKFVAHLGSLTVWDYAQEDRWKSWDIVCRTEFRDVKGLKKALAPVDHGGAEPHTIRWFWQSADDALSKLNGIDRPAIEAAIVKLIPRLDAATLEKFADEDREREKRWQKWQEEKAKEAKKPEGVRDMNNMVGMMLGAHGVCKLLLGLDSHADDEEIQATYRMLANVAHPDHGGDDAIFGLVHRVCKVGLNELSLDYLSEMFGNDFAKAQAAAMKKKWSAA